MPTYSKLEDRIILSLILEYFFASFILFNATRKNVRNSLYKLTVHEIEIHTSIQIDELNMTDKNIDKHEIKIENFRDTENIYEEVFEKIDDDYEAYNRKYAKSHKIKAESNSKPFYRKLMERKWWIVSAFIVGLVIGALGVGSLLHWVLATTAKTTSTIKITATAQKTTMTPAPADYIYINQTFGSFYYKFYGINNAPRLRNTT